MANYKLRRSKCRCEECLLCKPWKMQRYEKNYWMLFFSALRKRRSTEKGKRGIKENREKIVDKYLICFNKLTLEKIAE